MDTNNENHHQDLIGEDAVKKIHDFVDGTPGCFFCTSDVAGGPGDARPMTALQVDAQGNLWFVSASDSLKNLELAAEPSATLYFQASGRAEFMHLEGIATVLRDPVKLKELWSFTMKTWFAGGEDDPRVTLIKFAPTYGYYWDTKHGRAVASVRMLIGAVIGKALVDTVEGRLDV
ncbi:pyridoxamine 5'-phosphate oxidase family protein [Duganella violaceipulchra]|uniref:General stress protein 26 n=1 Tax=Duganella violaceipulchra TaxID=2849652 RepID=A0AA41HDA5_9BURK|nr:pyridoxamine 5'-phosphate oxidase family protein [Duganella violaceicalia]MBV6321698.1 pyridoxamine 5'-phosphate oxidase family protein [Duganella violaceicalia]MCP2011168.1 general stress protein 26 [Duganella violaceicalia]